MPNPKAERKKRFFAALALAETTAKAWARLNGITPEHLSRVLCGFTVSAPLEGKIDAFATRWLARIKEVA